MSEPNTHSYQAHPWHGVTPGERPPTLINTFIEMTAFDQMKYEIDKDTGMLVVDRPQQWGVSPPFAYGFVPRTLCGTRVAALSTADKADHDPLDVFVISEQPIRHSNVLVRATLVGGFPAIDGGEADDKLIAVVRQDGALSDVDNIDDVPRRLLERIEHYLRSYKPASDMYVGEPYGRLLAEQVVTAAIEDYANAFPSSDG